LTGDPALLASSASRAARVPVRRVIRRRAYTHLRPTYATGPTRKSARLNGMSVLPPTADVVRLPRHVRVVPIADMGHPNIDPLKNSDTPPQGRPHQPNTPIAGRKFFSTAKKNTSEDTGAKV
jgi:hypothetical protein